MDLDKEVKKVIDEDISPIISTHGGQIQLESVKDGVVTITLLGNCNGCPSAQITTEEIVKEILTQKLPNKIKNVVLSNGISDEMWRYAKNLIKNNR